MAQVIEMPKMSDTMVVGIVRKWLKNKGILRDKERADLGQAQSVVEHKRVITIEEVRRELDEMKRGAEDAETDSTS